VVHFIHNDIPYDCITNAQKDNFVVYNAEWTKEKLNYNWPSMVLPPPCDFRYYDVCENPMANKYITLISLNKNKGGEIFYEVARRMPDKQFLGVRGSYDQQLVEDLPNVTLIDNTPDILSVYKQTRILLMPSRYESWGRTATEAMCNGIPVICCPTEGLKENCGDAALYCTPREAVKRDAAGNIDMNDESEEPYDVSSIMKQIKKLDNPAFYKAVSDRSRERSRELDPQKDFKLLEEFLYITQQRQYA
jgi:glycosyltransferase involved in cell wall biosynthesis